MAPCKGHQGWGFSFGKQGRLCRGICTPDLPLPPFPMLMTLIALMRLTLITLQLSCLLSPTHDFFFSFSQSWFFPMCCSHAWFCTLTIGRRQFFYIFFKMFPGELCFNQGNCMFHYPKGSRLYQSLFVRVVMEVFIIIVKLNNGEEPVLKPLHKN